MKQWLKIFIVVFLIRPFVWYFLGLNRYSRLKVPPRGPFIVAANHNSHLDTVLLFALLPLSVATHASFVAAGDYFYKIPVLSWLMFKVGDMIPVWRRGLKDEDRPANAPSPVEAMAAVLQKGWVLILYPEGTRGMPEQRSELKAGVARVAIKAGNVPIIPVYMRGLGKALPRGELIFVPLIPQVAAGEPIDPTGKTEEEILGELSDAFSSLEMSFEQAEWHVV